MFGSSSNRAEQFVLSGTRHRRHSRAESEALQAELGREIEHLGWA